MGQVRRATEWQVISLTETGATHAKSGLPNQDRCSFHCFDNLSPVVLAVADGHGSPKSFRSHLGAEIAVDVAVQVGREFVSSLEGESPSRVKSEADQRLAKSIIQTWKSRVSDHLRKRPFTSKELDNLEAIAGAPAREALTNDELHAYGSTLLAVFVTEEYLLFFQLGDGEMLVADNATHTVSRPISRDPSLIANETPSLCLRDAIKFARTEFKFIHDALPAMILLSTDGFPNAMPNDEAFVRFVNQLLYMLCTSGVAAVKQEMPDWLRRATAEGSGDDVTVGILFRSEPQDSVTDNRADQCGVRLSDRQGQAGSIGDSPTEGKPTLQANGPQVTDETNSANNITTNAQDDKSAHSFWSHFGQQNGTADVLDVPQVSSGRIQEGQSSPPQTPEDL